jgi:phosphoesterase RecJ-like protein
MNKDSFLNKFKSSVDGASRIALVTHTGPDEDAISSVISMKQILVDKYKFNGEIKMLIEGSVFKLVNFLNGFEEIEWVNSLQNILEEYDLVIFLDTAETKHFSNTLIDEDVAKLNAVRIDHHLIGERKYFKFEWEDHSQYSCTAVLYDLFCRDNDSIDEELAQSLLTGIVGDSNFFKFISNENVDTFAIAAEILEKSRTSLRFLADQISNMSLEQFRILQILIGNMQMVDDKILPKFSYTYIELEDLKTSESGDLKLAGIKFTLNYLRYVGDYKWGFMIKPVSKNSYSVSFRSTKGAPNVAKIAQAFEGGGHVSSSGGKIDYAEPVKAEQVVKDVIAKLKTLDIEII